MPLYLDSKRLQASDQAAAEARTADLSRDIERQYAEATSPEPPSYALPTPGALGVADAASPVMSAIASMPQVGRRVREVVEPAISWALPSLESLGVAPTPPKVDLGAEPGATTLPGPDLSPQGTPVRSAAEMSADVPAPSGDLDESSPETFRQSLRNSAQVVADKYDLPADIIAAIPIQETGFRVSRLGREGNNLFSIKGEGPAGSMQFSEGAAPEDLNTPFRKYNNAAESFDDFGRLMTTQPRYAQAVAVWRQTRDSARFIEEVQKAGYATDWGDADGTGIPWWQKVVNISKDMPQSAQPRAARPAPTTPPPAEQTPGAEAQAFAAGSYTPNQINAATSEGLDYETALAVCGPAAAIAFARKNGRNPTMQEALGLAKQVGWTVEQGMAGPGSQQRLLQSMGVASRLVDGPPDWSAVAADVQRGNPVILSTPGHYFVAERYNPEDGTFDFGESAAVLKASGGRRWFRPEELPSLGMGDARASLFMDSPQSPAPSAVAGRSPNAGAESLPATAPAVPAAQVPTQPAAAGATSSIGQAATGDPLAMKTSEIGVPMPEDASDSERYADSLSTTLPPLGPPMRNEVPYDPETGQAGWPGMQRAPLDGGVPMRDNWASEPQQPYDPDQGARESGYVLPPVPSTYGEAGDTPPQQTVNPVYGPVDPWTQPNPEIPGSVRASDLPPLPVGADDRSWRQPPPPPQGGIVIPDAALDRMVPRYTQQPAPTPQEAPVAPLPPGGLRVPPVYRQEPAEDAAAEIERDRQYQPGPPSNPLEQAVSATSRAPFFREAPGEQAVSIFDAIQSLPFDAYATARRELISDAEARRLGGIDPIAPLRAAFPDAPWPSVETLNPDKRPAGDVLYGMLIAGALPDPTDPLVATAFRGVGRAASLTGRGVRAAGSAAGQAIDAGIEAAGPAVRRAGALLEQGRATAREASAMPGTSTFGTFGFAPAEQEMRNLTRTRVVPPEVADTLDFPIRIPDDPATIRAIEAAGGTVDPEKGVTLNVTRAQGESAAGRTAARGGVFYEAVPPGGRSSFVTSSDNPNAVGGTQVIPPTPTRFRSPLILSDAPGTDIGFREAMERLSAGRSDEIAVAMQRANETRTAYQTALARNGYREAAFLTPLRIAAEDAEEALGRLRPSPARIDREITLARAAGPEGSPARARALKDLVSRYGGDPNLIDDLLAIRGADASESAWAIKENILAGNARRQGYDGVVTVQEADRVNDAEIFADPAYQAAQKKVDDLQVEYDRAYREYQNSGGDSDLLERVDELQADIDAAVEEVDAIDLALRETLPTHRITELMDPREARNPTPGAAREVSLLDTATQLDAARTEWRRLAAEVQAGQGDLSALDAAQQRVAALEQDYDTVLRTGSQTVHEPPGYALREDIPRRPDPASVPTRSVSLNAGFGALPEESRRFYHGTAGAFERPDPGKFDPNGLFGPGYYLTSDPRVAGSYSGARAFSQADVEQAAEALPRVRAIRDALLRNGPDDPRLPDAERRLAALEQQLASGPNVRAVDVPSGLRLLDPEEAMKPAEVRRLARKLAQATGSRYFADLAQTSNADMGYLSRSYSGMLTEWRNTEPGASWARANQALASAGYDGLQHTGGKRVPMLDDAGNPIEHDVTIIFPESLTKITNAFSGEVGGAGLGALPPGGPRGSGILPAFNRAASEAIVGGTGGAVIEQARNPDEDPRTAAGRGFLLGAVGFPLATRVARRAARAAGATPEARGALATLGHLPEDAPRYRPELSREPTLPGMEPPPRVREAMPDVSDTPNRPPVLGDVPPSQVNQGMLPGLNPLLTERPAPIEQVAGQFQVPPSIDSPQLQRALSGAERRRDALEKAGKEPLSPLQWLRKAAGAVGYSSMIGPSTASVNVLGNLLEPLWAAPKEITRAILPRAIGGRGAPREAVEMAFGAGHGLMQTGTAILDALRARGRYAPNPDSPSLASQTINPFGHAVATGLEFGGRIFSGMPDAIFGTIARGAGEARRAAQIATDEGLKGAEWKRRVQTLLGEVEQHRKGELTVFPKEVDDIISSAERYADEQTFREQLGAVGKGASALAGRNVPVLGNLITPFFNTPWNMGVTLAERTPVGAVMNRRAGFDKWYDAVVGSALVTGLVVGPAAAGRITGSGPDDPEKRKMLEAEGWKQYHTLVGDTYVPNRLFGIYGKLLNAVGDAHDALAYQKKDGTPRNTGDDVLRRIGNLVKQEPYLQGMADLLELVGDRSMAGLERYAASTATRMVPYGATARTVGTSMDPNERETDRGRGVSIQQSIGQKVEQGLGLRSGLPIAQNVLGQPKENPQQGLASILPKTSPKVSQPLVRAYLDAGVDISAPPADIAGVTLSPQQQRRYRAVMGQELQRLAGPTVAGPTWQNVPPQVRKQLLETFHSTARTLAETAVSVEGGAPFAQERARTAVEKALGR